jgi:hypothetical protein
MARTHARILCSIWRDEKFVALPAELQRFYFLLLSQSDLSLCGVLPYRPKRWSRLTPDDTLRTVEEAVDGLERTGYVVVDRDTDELWIRTFIKWDGILQSHKHMHKAMWTAFDLVESAAIRKAFRKAFDELKDKGFVKDRGVGEGDGVGAGSQNAGAYKVLQRCARCDSLSVDCECPDLKIVG